MAEHRATREMTLNGRTYQRGEVVPLERVSRERPDLAKKLIEQRRVEPDAVRARKER